MPQQTVDGEIHTIFAYGGYEIATDIQHSITDRSVMKEFPEIPREVLQGLKRAVDMLIGFDNNKLEFTFTFKETLMTGDKMEEVGELRKVFGIIWNKNRTGCKWM